MSKRKNSGAINTYNIKAPGAKVYINEPQPNSKTRAIPPGGHLLALMVTYWLVWFSELLV